MNRSLCTVSGAVLAGGQSRRIGQDKASLLFGGITLLERSVRILQSVVAPVVVAGGQPHRYSLPGIPCLGDAIADCGPLGGILAALEETSADAVIVLACDLPFVTPGLIRSLSLLPSASPLVITTSDGIVQPLCGRYPSSLKATLRRFLMRGDRKVLDFVESQKLQYLVIADTHPLYQPRLLMNINTREDLIRAEADVTNREF